MSAPIQHRGRRPDDAGFTLVELLVVIVILGVLSGVVVFAVGGIGDKGQESACRIDRRTLQTAQEAYFAAPAPRGGAGSYATGEDVLVSNGFLAEVSTLHDTARTGDTYAVTPQGSTCSA